MLVVSTRYYILHPVDKIVIEGLNLLPGRAGKYDFIISHSACPVWLDAF